MVKKYPDRFDGLQPREVYIRLVQISDDPDKLVVTRDLFALPGDRVAGSRCPQIPSDQAVLQRCGAADSNSSDVNTAIHQICRQQLDAFHSELLRTRGIELRDIRREVIKRRLLSVATSDQTGFLAGGTSAFDSLRQIRKEQQLKKTEAMTALVKAKPYYCPAPTGRRVPQLSRQLADPGGMFVHLRSLVRRIPRIAPPPPRPRRLQAVWRGRTPQGG